MLKENGKTEIKQTEVETNKKVKLDYDPFTG